MFVAKNIRVLEVDITNAPAVGNIYKLPLDQELQGKNFKAIETFFVTEQNRGPNNIQTVSQAEAADIVCYFYVGSKLELFAIPYTMLNTALNNGIIRQLANMKIVIEKSYIQIVSTSTIVTNRCALFAFHYD